MGNGFISDFGITLFHTLHSLSHWQFSRRSNFQPVVIYRNLYRPMIQVTAMHHGIDNQLTNGIRWNLINILPINSYNGSTQMNISQDKLKCFIYLLPKRSGIFSAVNKYRFRCTFKYATLRCNMKSTVAGQNSKSIRRIIFSIALDQNSQERSCCLPTSLMDAFCSSLWAFLTACSFIALQRASISSSVIFSPGHKV